MTRDSDGLSIDPIWIRKLSGNGDGVSLGTKKALVREVVLLDLLWTLNELGFLDWGFCGRVGREDLGKAIKAELREDSTDLLSDWRSCDSGKDLEILIGKTRGIKWFDSAFHIRFSEISSLMWVSFSWCLGSIVGLYSLRRYDFYGEIDLISLKACRIQNSDLATLIWNGNFMVMATGLERYKILVGISLNSFMITSCSEIGYLSIELTTVTLFLGVFIRPLHDRIKTSQSIVVLVFSHFYSLINLVFFGFFGVVPVTMSQSQWMVKSGGKTVEAAKPRLKISVPRFDNTEIIAQYSKTLIGRCMNPPKQDMRNLLFMLPRFCLVEGNVVGTDLGLGRFRFDFEREEDIIEVLKIEPFHFDNWMLSIVRWKPVLEPNYPSRITFWVRVLDVPMQFWAASTFRGVGEALGIVHGEVDLMEGRVRVELDSFKPLVFSMDVDFAEGVELAVNLRYDRLVGFCRLCARLTHDQSRCPTKVKEVTDIKEERPSSDTGPKPLSYKAAVGDGGDLMTGPAEGDDKRNRGLKEDIKGKGIAREGHGPYRQEGRSRGRYGGGYGEGPARRQHGYGAPREDQRRFAINTRGVQQLRDGEGTNLSHPQKLMMDAFKGVHHRPKDNQEMKKEAGSSGIRKSLLFEESVAMVGLEEVPITQNGNEVVQRQVDVEKEPKGVVGEVQGVGAKVADHNSSLDDANLMVDGVILSDSELLDEEWEEGEVPDFMEEMEMGLMATEAVGTEDTEAATIENGGEEEAEAKMPKKKGSKTGAGGGATGTRLVHKLLSPRKTKIVKVPVKNGEGKKAGNKP